MIHPLEKVEKTSSKEPPEKLQIESMFFFEKLFACL